VTAQYDCPFRAEQSPVATERRRATRQPLRRQWAFQQANLFQTIIEGLTAVTVSLCYEAFDGVHDGKYLTGRQASEFFRQLILIQFEAEGLRWVIVRNVRPQHGDVVRVLVNSHATTQRDQVGGLFPGEVDRHQAHVLQVVITEKISLRNSIRRHVDPSRLDALVDEISHEAGGAELDGGRALRRLG
jgi:hypothetical protein